MISGPVRFLAHKARSAFGRALTIDAASSEKRVLCPAESVQVEPAVHFPEHLDRILSVPPKTNLETELASIGGGLCNHAETAAYRFTGARLYGGSIFAGGYRRYLKKFERPADGECVELGSAALISSVVGLQYFGHWLGDDMATHDLAEDGQTRLSLPLANWPDVELYCNLLDRDFQIADNAVIRELTIFRDFSQNSLKGKRYKALRDRLRSRVEPAKDGDIVYLGRGATGEARRIANDEDFVRGLQARGVKVLSLEHDSTLSILQALHGARMFITVEGSQQKHCLYAMPDSASILLIQPPRRFNLLMKGFADCVGWPTGFVVAEDRGDQAFYVNPDEVLRMVDKLLDRL